jgi:hypothetical protein
MPVCTCYVPERLARYAVLRQYATCVLRARKSTAPLCVQNLPFIALFPSPRVPRSTSPRLRGARGTGTVASPVPNNPYAELFGTGANLTRSDPPTLLGSKACTIYLFLRSSAHVATCHNARLLCQPNSARNAGIHYHVGAAATPATTRVAAPVTPVIRCTAPSDERLSMPCVT